MSEPLPEKRYEEAFARYEGRFVTVEKVYRSTRGARAGIIMAKIIDFDTGVVKYVDFANVKVMC